MTSGRIIPTSISIRTNRTVVLMSMSNSSRSDYAGNLPWRK